MPKIDYKVEYPYIETFRTAKVAGMFDISPEKKLSKEWHIDLPIENLSNWNIGLIVGASGAGKTIMSKQLFGETAYHNGFMWNNDKSFLEDFPKDILINDIVDALSHIGFSSPPNWLLPFHKLSNGQKFRADIARILFEHKDLVVIDEFTSVIDRQVAKIGCVAIQKFIRKKNKKIVALSCHYDIKKWLEPDWVYDISSNQYFAGRLQRPQIQLEIYKCKSSLWSLFKEHHYLSSNIKSNAQCFVGLINENPATFCSFIHFQHPILKNTKREHRLVTLPDYQGIGLGNIISNWAAQYCKNNGFDYISTTSHPAMIFSRIKSKEWIMIRAPGLVKSLNKNYKNKNQTSWNRITATFKYIGT